MLGKKNGDATNWTENLKVTNFVMVSKRKQFILLKVQNGTRGNFLASWKLKNAIIIYKMSVMNNFCVSKKEKSDSSKCL